MLLAQLVDFFGLTVEALEALTHREIVEFFLHIVKVAFYFLKRLDVIFPLFTKLAHHLHDLSSCLFGMKTFGCLTYDHQKGVQREWRAQHNLALEGPVDEAWVCFMDEASNAFVGHEKQYVVERVLCSRHRIVSFLQLGDSGTSCGDELALRHFAHSSIGGGHAFGI